MHSKNMLLIVLFGVLAQGANAQQIRIASYNIKFLSTNAVNQGGRVDRLRDVVQDLDADIIGLQEIDDRAALSKVGRPARWSGGSQPTAR